MVSITQNVFVVKAITFNIVSMDAMIPCQYLSELGGCFTENQI